MKEPMSTFWNLLAVSGLGVAIGASLVVAAAAALTYLAHIVLLATDLLGPVFPGGTRHANGPHLIHLAERADTP